MKLKIIRTYNDKGTNGVLFVNNVFFAFTIELPWHNNMRGISCIPEDTYEVTERESEKHGKHLWLPEVKGREFILFHGANNALKDLRGCIAPVFRICGQGMGDTSQLTTGILYNAVTTAIAGGEKIKLEVTNLDKHWKSLSFIKQ
jgi:hypothetical protein